MEGLFFLIYNICRLYNKESIINKLLDKSTSNTVADHIRKLKDVRELNFYTGQIKLSGKQSDQFFTCPITGLEMSGIHSFLFLWSCGCVFAKKAIFEVGDGRCMMVILNFEFMLYYKMLFLINCF